MVHNIKKDKMKTYYIYHIPGIKIGCTSDLNKRMADQGFTDWNILEEHTDIHVASDREIELQKEYGYKVDSIPYWKSVKNRFKATKESARKAADSRVINGTSGGWKHSEETLEKMKGRNLGRKNTEETLEKMRGRIVSEETRSKLSRASKGRKLSKEARQKLSKAHTGKKLDKPTLESFNSKRSEKVTCPHCNKEGAKFNMTRFHFDNCKINKK